MYLSYYKLNKKPFQISTDPNFFWLGEKHKEALSILKYGVMDDKGFLLLTGDVGTGKTTLINSFVSSLGDEVILARVSDPSLTQSDFINYIAKMFRIDTEFKTKSEFLILFTRFLEQANKNDKKVLLIIDEAQQLLDETLEEIRLLSNIENQDKKLLNIFLVGQSEFNETLEKYKNRALRQRLTLNITLYPLKPEETKACIEFRLKIAGSKKEVFTPEAIDAIHTISNGFPRVINIICDHALRLGCQQNQEVISAAIVHQCSQSIYALQPSRSHHHNNYVGSNNEWLEESEVPPLSPEAIDRICKPLPDYIVEEDNEVETKEKSQSYRIAVPLLLAVLLLSGYFLFKDDNLATVSNYITTLKKNIIDTTKEKDPTITESPTITQHSKPSVPLEKVQISEDSTTLPVTITKKQIKQRFEINTTEETLQVDQIKTDTPATGEKPKSDISIEVVQKIKEPATTEPTGPTTSSNELAATDVTLISQKTVGSKSNVTPPAMTVETPPDEQQEENFAEPAELLESQPDESVALSPSENENKIANKLPSQQPPPKTSSVDNVFEPPVTREDKTTEVKDVLTITDPTAGENYGATEAATSDTDEEKNITLEVIKKQSVVPIDTATAGVENSVDIATQSTLRPNNQTAPQDIKPPAVLTEVKPEPQLPPSTSKKSNKTNDDPGAVIDWLLKSKQN